MIVMKNFFKRSLALVFVFALVLCPLASCGETDVTTTTPPETEPPVIDYTQFPYTEEAGAISICGTPISDYRIVIPAECDLYTKYAAQNLKDYLKANADIELEIVTDAEEATETELLIGKTNRPGSVTASEVELYDDEYIIMLDGKSVVLYGNGYMVGGAAGELMNRRAAGAWRGYDIDITDIPTTPEAVTFTFEKANNAILLIGDGMGHNHINMTLADSLDKFSAADMPHIGEIITKSQSVINKQAAYTDSAAAGTALATGFKTINGYIGIDPNKQDLVSLRALANSVGAKTAILSTDAITGATPAAFLAHEADRNSTAFIQRDINAVLEAGEVDYAIGSIGDDLVDRAAPVLHDISAHGSQFFSMIEEGQIDKKAHNNDASGVIHMVKRFDGLIAYCMEFIMFHPDTVVIVTADHETGGIRKAANADKYIFTSGNHTNTNVPIYAIGDGTEIFAGEAKDNTRVPNFIAKIYGEDNFGDPAFE